MKNPGKAVTIYSEGVPLSCILWLPKNVKKSQKNPAIVVARGFASIKEFVTPGFAKRLNEEGYIVMGFDYRGIGKSGGVPGRHLPLECCEDIRACMTYLEKREDVDPQKIGLLGDSMGGSHVIQAAGVDSRAKATISYGGPGDMVRWFRGLVGYQRFIEWKKRIEEDRRQRVTTGKSEYVSSFDFLAFSEREKAEWDEIKKTYPQQMPPITIETVEKYLEYFPEHVVDKIAPRALFLVTTETGIVVPPDETLFLYEKAKDPKKLWVIPPSTAEFRYATHMHGEGYTEPLAKAFIDFYKEYIPPA